MYIPIIGDLIGLGKTYIEGKQKKSQAKAEAEAKVMIKAAESHSDWESIMAKASESSWKDEFLVIVLFIPAIACFFPGGSETVAEGFAALSTMPDYYQNFLYIAVLASFGLKAGKGITSQFKGKGNKN